jgi:hypothetical protein
MATLSGFITMVHPKNETFDIQRLVTRDEFIAFWEDSQTPRLRQLAPHAIYLGGLALYTIVIRLIDTTGRLALPALAGGIALVVLVPIRFQ